MKISNEFKIGFWTIIAILVLVFGIQYLKGINSLRRGQFYYVVSNNVEGLANSGPVKVNGFQVGLVRSMTYDKASGNIVVEVNLEESSLKIPTDSHASIQTDLLGTSYVVITLGKANTYLQSRDTIAGGEKTAGLLDGATPIIASVNEIMPKLDTLICGINTLVNESKMQESLIEINALTQQLNTTVALLNKYLKGDIPEILDNVNSLTANIDTLTSEVKDAEVGALITKANATLETTNKLLTALMSNDGSVGKAINTTELHDQLTSTIASVDSLITDIKEHPKRYINIKLFGK